MDEGAWGWSGGTQGSKGGSGSTKSAPGGDLFKKLGVISGAANAKPNLEDIWLIDDLLPLKGLSLLYGRPGTGKSLLALSFALHIAAGRPWRGLDTVSGPVVYATLEGGGVFTNRVAALRSTLSLSDAELARFYRITVGLNLRDKATGMDIRDLMRAIAERDGEPVRILTIDTLNRGFGGGSESKDEDMGQFIDGCIETADLIESNVQIVHHPGKDEERGARGHSSLIGAVDTELKLVRVGELSPLRTLTVTKQRDGEDGATFGFRVDSVLVGTTKKGKDVFAPVLVDDDEAKAAAKSPTPKGANQTTLWECWQHLAAESTTVNPGGAGWPDPGLFTIVPAEALLKLAVGKLAPPEEGKPDKRRENLKRALETLTKPGGLLCMNEGWVWNPARKKV